MTGHELRAARGRLGDLWSLGRPLRMAELGRVLGLQGRDVGATVRDWERGKSPISGPAGLADAVVVVPGLGPGPVLAGQHGDKVDVVVAVPDGDPPDGLIFLTVGG